MDHNKNRCANTDKVRQQFIIPRLGRESIFFYQESAADLWYRFQIICTILITGIIGYVVGYGCGGGGGGGNQNQGNPLDQPLTCSALPEWDGDDKGTTYELEHGLRTTDYGLRT